MRSEKTKTLLVYCPQQYGKSAGFNRPRRPRRLCPNRYKLFRTKSTAPYKLQKVIKASSMTAFFFETILLCHSSSPVRRSRPHRRDLRQPADARLPGVITSMPQQKEPDSSGSGPFSMFR